MAGLIGVEGRVEDRLRVAGLEADWEARDPRCGCDSARPQPDPTGPHAELPAVGEAEARVVAGRAGDVHLAAEDRVGEQKSAEGDACRRREMVGRIGDCAHRPQVEASPQVVVRSRTGWSRRTVAAAARDEKERQSYEPARTGDDKVVHLRATAPRCFRSCLRGSCIGTCTFQAARSWSESSPPLPGSCRDASWSSSRPGHVVPGRAKYWSRSRCRPRPGRRSRG